MTIIYSENIKFPDFVQKDEQLTFNRSALTFLWKIILSDGQTHITQALEATFSQYLDPEEDLRKFNFTPLHKVGFRIDPNQSEWLPEP